MCFSLFSPAFGDLFDLTVGDAFARPVHTSADGDSVYAVSVGSVAADLDLVGTLAADVVSEAILRAVYSAESAYGFLSARDFHSSAG